MLQVASACPEAVGGAELIRRPDAIPVVDTVERHGLPLDMSRGGMGSSDEIANPPADRSIDERGQPGPFRIVSRQTPPQIDGQLLLVIFSGHAREQRSASEALGVEPDGLGRVGVKDVVAVPQSIHECRRRRGRGQMARSPGGGEFSTDIRCSTAGGCRRGQLSHCSQTTSPRLEEARVAQKKIAGRLRIFVVEATPPAPTGIGPASHGDPRAGRTDHR